MTDVMREIEIPEKTPLQDIFESNQNHLDDVALDYYGNQLTYSEFFEEINRYAKSFKQMGVKKGDVVTICMLSEPEFVIGYYALGKIGATCNGVSINFLKNNLKKYTDGKNSQILFIYEALYDQLKEKVGDTNIKNIILAPIHSYMSEENQKKYNQGDYLDSLSSQLLLPKDKEYIRFKEFLETGKKDRNLINSESFDKDRINCYLYSSGTTAEPKCIMFTDKTPVALGEMHSHVDMNEKRGDRTLIIIPMYYATSLFYCMHLQLKMGKTLLFQPFYNRDTFAKDLMENEVNHSVATISHYMPIVNSDLPPNSLSKFRLPITGGEAVLFGQKSKIDKKLLELGSNEIIIGGGTTELGSCAQVDYNSKGKMHITGSFLPGIKWKIIDPKTEKELGYDEVGEYVCNTPAAMKGYYQNPEKTKQYFWTDEFGQTYQRPGDIAVKVKIPTENGHKDGILVKGRKEDSYVDKQGKTIYLFDIEEKVANDPAIVECKAVALNKEQENTKCVLHVVITNDSKDKKADIINRLSKLYNFDGIKIRENFEINSNTGKRDNKILEFDKEDFYLPYNEYQLQKIEFLDNEEPIIRIVNNEEIYEKSFVRTKKKFN